MRWAPRLPLLPEKPRARRQLAAAYTPRPNDQVGRAPPGQPDAPPRPIATVGMSSAELRAVEYWIGATVVRPKEQVQRCWTCPSSSRPAKIPRLRRPGSHVEARCRADRRPRRAPQQVHVEDCHVPAPIRSCAAPSWRSSCPHQAFTAMSRRSDSSLRALRPSRSPCCKATQPTASVIRCALRVGNR